MRPRLSPSFASLRWACGRLTSSQSRPQGSSPSCWLPEPMREMLTRTSLRAPSAATIFLWPRAGFATVSSSAARAAAAVLEGAGHPASDETDRRIRATLQAAATGDVAQRVALWKGTLDRDLDATGFGAPEEPEDDPAELAEILAPLRRASSPTELANQGRAAASPDLVARRQAERDAAGLRAVAKRARAAADAKRGQADRLAEEARGAAEEASAAEHAADAAEDAASTAEAALDR